MNTKDVFNYFQEFAAGSIEWIDDDSCKLTLLHSERPKLYTILALLSAIGLISVIS